MKQAVFFIILLVAIIFRSKTPEENADHLTFPEDVQAAEEAIEAKKALADAESAAEDRAEALRIEKLNRRFIQDE